MQRFLPPGAELNQKNTSDPSGNMAGSGLATKPRLAYYYFRNSRPEPGPRPNPHMHAGEHGFC